MSVINLAQKMSLVRQAWAPKVIAALNDMHVKLARLEGAFVWHAHQDTDELFFVLEGHFDMHFRDRVVTVRKGELLVVPKGVEHKPVATDEACMVLLVEPAGTINTGDAGGDRTAKAEWI